MVSADFPFGVYFESQRKPNTHCSPGPGSKFRKSDWYSEFIVTVLRISNNFWCRGVWQGTQKTDLFAERNIATHAALKRNISRVYSMSALTALEKWVDDAIECFLQRMHDQGSHSVDLGYWLQLLAFGEHQSHVSDIGAAANTVLLDVIGEVSFSRRFGFLEAGKDDGTLTKIETALGSLAWVGQMPWVFWLDHYLAPFIGHHLGLVLRHGTIRKYASREVQARRDRPSEHDDILGKLFEVQKQKPDELDDSAITSIATANIFAGSDTTAISLRAIVYFCLKNPPYLERLRKETEERKADHRLSFPARFSQVSDWPYLQAVISEALRLHPAVGMNLPRVVPDGGAHVGGHYLPAGVWLRCGTLR